MYLLPIKISNDQQCLINDIPMTQVCESTEAHKVLRSSFMWAQSSISNRTLILAPCFVCLSVHYSYKVLIFYFFCEPEKNQQF